jgi:hypothetical protein
MADYTADRSGQINSAGDNRALFLKLFAGEILQKLPEVRSTLGMTNEKTLREGKEFQFPYTGTITPAYHVPGTELTGQSTNNAERVIALDDLMVVDRFTPKIDKWMQHFDDRAPYARQMGESLGILMDEHVLMEGVLGARASSVVTGNGADGLVITSDKFKLDTGVPANAQDTVELATAIKAGLKEAAANFKVKNVAAGMKKVFYCSWDLYFNILDAVDTNGFSLFNKDYVSNGSLEQGMLPHIYGIEIRGTNNLNTTNLTGIANAQAANGEYFYHQVDMSKTVGLVMCERAVATVKASDIAVEADPYQARYKGQLITADYMAGHGWLRPECLVEFELDTTTN